MTFPRHFPTPHQATTRRKIVCMQWLKLTTTLIHQSWKEKQSHAIFSNQQPLAAPAGYQSSSSASCTSSCSPSLQWTHLGEDRTAVSEDNLGATLSFSKKACIHKGSPLWRFCILHAAATPTHSGPMKMMSKKRERDRESEGERARAKSRVKTKDEWQGRHSKTSWWETASSQITDMDHLHYSSVQCTRSQVYRVCQSLYHGWSGL